MILLKMVAKRTSGVRQKYLSTVLEKFNSIPSIIGQYTATTDPTEKANLRLYLKTAWYCVNNIPKGSKDGSSSDLFLSALDSNPKNAVDLFQEAYKASPFKKYQEQTRAFFRLVGEIDKAPEVALVQISTAIRELLDKYAQNPLPGIAIPEDHAYIKVVLGAFPDPENPANVISLNYIQFNSEWTPIHNHPVIMADGIVSGTMKELVVKKGPQDTFEIIEENHYPQGAVLSDYDPDQRWHIVQSGSAEGLVTLNAYYGPASQHVVDVDKTSTSPRSRL